MMVLMVAFRGLGVDRLDHLDKLGFAALVVMLFDLDDL